MNNIMQAILEIEKKAQSIIDSADELKSEQSAELTAELEALTEKSRTRTEKELAALRSSADDAKKQELNKLDREHELQLDALREICEKNTTKWINDVYQKVIKC